MNEELFQQHLIESLALMHKNLALPVPYERTTHAEISSLIQELEKVKAMKAGLKRLVRSMTPLDRETQTLLTECYKVMGISIKRVERYVIRSVNQLERR